MSECQCAVPSKVEVKIKKLNEDAVIPQYAHEGDAGADLVSVEECIVRAGCTAVVGTGIALEIPMHYEVQVRPRSGLAAKNGITVLNSPGTIDCVPFGTKIKTLDGEINVEDILDSEEKIAIYSYNEETNSIEEDIVEDSWVVKDSELIKIETQDDTVEVPPLKEVFTRKGWVRANELTTDDEILSF